MENNKIKILAIDDNQDNLITLKALIGESFPDTAIYTETDGSRGIEAAEYHQPDVILLDILMPGMDGYEVCSKIKTNPILADIPIVFITALKSDKESRIRALESGGEAFLTKPIDHSELTAQIRAMVKIRKAYLEKHNEKERLAALVKERTSQLQKELEERKKAEQALKQSEELLRGIFDNLQDAYFRADSSGNFTLVSPSAIIMYGYHSADELIGSPAEQLYANPDERNKLLNTLRSKGNIRDYTLKAKRKNGSEFWVSMNVQFLLDGKGIIIGTEGVVRDISERIMTERMLKESEERFQMLFNQAPLGYQSLDFDGNFIEVNQKWLDTLGYSREDVIGKWFGDFLSHEYRAGFRNRFPLFKAQGFIHSEFEMVNKNGDKLFIAFEGKIGYDILGQFKQTHCILQDITLRKQAEEKLRESVEEYRNLIEFSPVAMAIIHDWKTIYFNPSAIHLFGAKTQDELLGKHIFELIHHDFHCLAIENSKLLAQKGYLSTQVQKYIKLDGTVLDVETQAKTIRFNDDTATLVVINDITERKKAEEALRRSEENLSITLHSIGDGVISTDINGLIVNMNPVSEKLCGWKLNEALGKPLPDVFKIYNSETLQNITAPVERVLEKGEIVGLVNNTVLISKHGTEYQISNSAAPIKNNKGEITGVVLVFSDVSEKYLAEKNIKDSEERYRNLLENLEAGIVVHAPDTSILMSNNRASELLGLSHDQIRGKVALDQSWSFLNQDNTQLAIDQYPVNKIITSKQPIKNKIWGIYQTKTNNVVWVRVNGFPVFDNKGEIAEIVISFIDITERKKAEEALRKSEAIKNKIVSNIGDVIVIIDKNGINQYKSPNITALFGWKPEELLGKSTWDSVHPDDLNAVQRFHRTILTQPDATGTTEFRYKHKNGNYVWIEIKVVNLLHDKDIQGILGNYHDISERKKAEQELISAKENAEQSETFLSAIIENQPGLVWLKNINGKFLKTNTKFLNSCSLNASEQIFMKTDYDIWPKKMAVKYITDDLKVIKSKQSLIVEELIIDHGTDKWFETFKTPIVDDKGNVIGTTGFSIEITERKKAELEILAAKEKA